MSPLAVAAAILVLALALLAAALAAFVRYFRRAGRAARGPAPPSAPYQPPPGADVPPPEIADFVRFPPRAPEPRRPDDHAGGADNYASGADSDASGADNYAGGADASGADASGADNYAGGADASGADAGGADASGADASGADARWAAVAPRPLVSSSYEFSFAGGRLVFTVEGRPGPASGVVLPFAAVKEAFAAAVAAVRPADDRRPALDATLAALEAALATAGCRLARFELVPGAREVASAPLEGHLEARARLDRGSEGLGSFEGEGDARVRPEV